MMSIKNLTRSSNRQIYTAYFRLFFVLLVIIFCVDSLIYTQKFDHLAFVNLSEIINFSTSVALIVMGLITAVLYATKRIPHATIWLLLAILNVWVLSQATTLALGAGSFYLAVHEQLLYSGPPAQWQQLGITMIFYVALPITIAYAGSVIIEKRKRLI